MSDLVGMVAIVVRVGTPGHPAFQLRKGEVGLSVFDPSAVDPPLGSEEILESFREGSVLITRPIAFIEELGLLLESIPGAESLPDRLRFAHREIHPGPGMTRNQFKVSLKELERYGSSSDPGD
jgi:hypothetical protein